jgi:hypothetical protein
MFSKLRLGLTYANVIATLALFLALGGGAYAAFKLPKNSVGSKQLKANAVNSAKVADGSLLAGDFRAGQLPAGAQGAKGDTGLQGPKGDPCSVSDPSCKGPKGDAGSAVAYARVAADGTLDAAHSKNITSILHVAGTQGVYCVAPSVPVTNVVVSIPHALFDTYVVAQADIPANGDTASSDCSTLPYVVLRSPNGMNVDHAFYVLFN